MSDTLDEQEAWEQAAFEREQHQEYEQKIATLQNDIKRKDKLIASANVIIEKLKEEMKTQTDYWEAIVNSLTDRLERYECPHGKPKDMYCDLCSDEARD